MKASSSRTKKNKDEGDGSDKESSKEEEMRLFVKCCNQYMRKHKLKHSNKNMINFKKSHSYKKQDKRKEEDDTCFECRRSGHFRTTCLSFTKHPNKKDKEFYKMMGIHDKGRRSYIVWEE